MVEGEEGEELRGKLKGCDEQMGGEMGDFEGEHCGREFHVGSVCELSEEEESLQKWMDMVHLQH